MDELGRKSRARILRTGGGGETGHGGQSSHAKRMGVGEGRYRKMDKKSLPGGSIHGRKS